MALTGRCVEIFRSCTCYTALRYVNSRFSNSCGGPGHCWNADICSCFCKCFVYLLNSPFKLGKQQLALITNFLSAVHTSAAPAVASNSTRAVTALMQAALAALSSQCFSSGIIPAPCVLAVAALLSETRRCDVQQTCAWRLLGKLVRKGDLTWQGTNDMMLHYQSASWPNEGRNAASKESRVVDGADQEV